MLYALILALSAVVGAIVGILLAARKAGNINALNARAHELENYENSLVPKHPGERSHPSHETRRR